MRLNEIFNTSFTNRKHPEDDLKSTPWGRDRLFGRDNKIGTGGTYIAYSDDDPHMVTKKSRYPHPASGFKPGTGNRDVSPGRIYAETIIKNKLAQSNPFFPRFYVHHTDTDKSGNKYYKFTTEKLISAREISYKEALTVLKHIFANKKDRKLFIRTFEEDTEPYDRENARAIMDDVGWFLTNMIDHQRFNAASDHLNQALKVIHKLKKEHGLSDDLISDNIMFRRSRNGLQMVLNDPVG